MEIQVIAFIRASTDRQEVDSQTEEVVAMIKHDYPNYEVGKEIKVIGRSGASARKQDEAYKADVEEAKQTIIDNPSIHSVYIWAVDRLGRNMLTLMTLKEFVKEKKVQLIVKNPSLRLLKEDKTVDYTADFTFNTLANVASIEMEQKAARFARGRKANDKKGRYNGGFVPYGYMVDENGYIVIKEEDAKVVRLIFKELAKGKVSCDALARELQSRGILFRGKKMLFSNVRGILKNKVYCGEQVSQAGIVRNIPPIVSRELYYKACAAVSANGTNLTNATSNRNLLGLRLMVCPDCGAHYTAAHKLYCCHNHNRNYYDSRQGFEKCPNGISIGYKNLDRLIWYVASNVHIKYLKELKAQQDIDISEQVEIIEQKIAEQNRRIDLLAERRRRINKLYKEGDISDEERDSDLAKLITDNDKFTLTIKELEDEKASLIALKSGSWADDYYFDNIVSLFQLDDSEKKIAIVRKHISNVVLEKAEYKGYKRVLKITFKFKVYPDMEFIYLAKSLGEFFPLVDGNMLFNYEGKPISYKAQWFFRDSAIEKSSITLDKIDRLLDLSKPIHTRNGNNELIIPKHELTI